jgi:cytochrome c peroxidase
MIRKTIVIAGITLIAAGAAWGKDDLMQRAKAVFKPVPSTAPALKGNKGNVDRLQLGKMLFFEPRLSASYLISCNTCHNVGLGGADLQETSTGHGWQKGPRNAPTVLNSVFNIAQFWDGRAPDLAAQAKGPVQASVEMNSKPEQVVTTLKSIPGYVKLFGKAFPGEKEPVTFDNMAKAIELFEATLITPDAPFDKYLKGNATALKAKEKEGLALFIDKGCVACHGGVNMGGAGYFPFGLKETPLAELLPPDDLGRFTVTNTASDKYVYKSPSLRNIALTPPYFHTGKVWKLKDAVVVMGTAQLGIKLNDDETDKITAFLLTLNGRQPKVEYPILPEGSDSTPKPVLK